MPTRQGLDFAGYIWAAGGPGVTKCSHDADIGAANIFGNYPLDAGTLKRTSSVKSIGGEAS